jgi:hypothetical protein
MWGYYGAKHEGVRIHVRREFCQQAGFSLIRVQYQQNDVIEHAPSQRGIRHQRVGIGHV